MKDGESFWEHNPPKLINDLYDWCDGEIHAAIIETFNDSGCYVRSDEKNNIIVEFSSNYEQYDTNPGDSYNKEFNLKNAIFHEDDLESAEKIAIGLEKIAQQLRKQYE